MSRIFVCVGSRPYPFDRLFRELDSLVASGIIQSEVFAQIGTSTYEPTYFEWVRFLDPDSFEAELREADIVISHGASGSIMGALNAGKRVIAVTRLAKYGEHVNNHQIKINESLAAEHLVAPVFDMDSLGKAILGVESGEIELREWQNDDPLAVVRAVDEFIRNELL